MFRWKKAAAIVAAAAMTVAGAGCTVGSGTAYAMTIDGEKVDAGIYIYYAYQSYMELTQDLQSQNSELDVSDDKVVKEQKMDGVSAEEWIKNKTLEYCQDYVAFNKQFDELGLSLEEKDKTDINSTMDSFWDKNGETYEKNGISKNSVKSVLESIYKSNELFLYYYDAGGEEGVTEDELKEYYVDNNARVRYLKFDLKDGNGDALDDAGKKDMKAKVEDYLSQIEAKSDEDAMEKEMDAVQSDYNAYVTSISEEAAAETATSATDADGNEIPATTTEATTTTTEETTTTTTAAEDSAETTATAGDESAADTTAAEDSAADETTTTAAEDGSEDNSAETTTTTSPYASENIIAKVTTDKDTKEEDITYTPSEKVYNYIFNDAKQGVLDIVEDDDAYYIVLCRDITERMTEDDLWTEEQRQSVASQKYGDDFKAKEEDWRNAQKVEKNDSAIKRYDAFKIDMDSSSASN